MTNSHIKSKLLLTKTDFTVFDTTQRQDTASYGLIQGSGFKVLATRPGLVCAHLGSQQHSYPLFCSFHFYDFGCQAETS